MYHIDSLTYTEYKTLKWLSDRGYDAGILEIAGVKTFHEDGSVTLNSIPEHKAWEIYRNYEDDKHAFLSCNGSPGLSTKLFTFINSIV